MADLVSEAEGDLEARVLLNVIVCKGDVEGDMLAKRVPNELRVDILVADEVEERVGGTVAEKVLFQLRVGRQLLEVEELCVLVLVEVGLCIRLPGSIRNNKKIKKPRI